MYAVHKRIEENFLPYTNPSFGAIKPALVRLEKNGFLTSAKIMSDGGKLSVFYSITKDGMKELKKLLLKPFSNNALQFLSDASVKLSCASFLSKEEALDLFEEVKSNALFHKLNAEGVLSDAYNPIDFYQRIVLDSTICQYKNLITMVEGFEKK